MKKRGRNTRRKRERKESEKKRKIRNTQKQCNKCVNKWNLIIKEISKSENEVRTKKVTPATD